MIMCVLDCSATIHGWLRSGGVQTGSVAKDDYDDVARNVNRINIWSRQGRVMNPFPKLRRGGCDLGR